MTKREKIFFLIISALIWVYLCLKAYSVPLVHDEVATFFYYIQLKDFLPFHAHWDANNHILNSAIATLFYSLFGSSELVLRLSNLIFFPVFAFYCFKISNELTNRFIKWAFIIILLFTHNFIEFFALSRGYGISMALVLGTIFYLMRALKNHDFKSYLLCIVFGFFSLTANLNLITTILILNFILIFNIALNYKIYKRLFITKLIFVIPFLGIAPICFFAFYMNEMKNHGLLYYGKLNGFWEITVKSISILFTGFNNSIFPSIFMMLFLLSILIFVILYIRKLHPQLIVEKSLIFFILLIGNISAIFFLAIFFKINYPEDRVGIYLYPYLVGSICFLTDKFIAVTNRKLILLLFLPFAFFPVHFLFSLNLTYSALWHEDKIPKRFFDKIYAEYKAGKFPQTIGGNQMRLFCWTYQNYRNGGNLGIIHYWNYPEADEDYQIVRLKNYLPDWKNYYDSLDYDKFSELLLLKRKKNLERSIISTKEITTNGNISDEYFDICKIPADTLKNNKLYLGYKLTVQSDSEPFPAWIVVEVRDKNDKSIDYEFICLNWLKLKYSGEKNNFINGLVIHKIPVNADKVITYFWNMNKNPYNLKGNFSAYILK